MSWDVIIQDLPENVNLIEEIPDDFTPGYIGQRANIIQRIKDVVPHVVFRDTSWTEALVELQERGYDVQSYLKKRHRKHDYLSETTFLPS